MTKIKELLDELYVKSEKRFNDFKIEEIDSISHIKDDAYLEKPTWVGGDTEFVCLFIDLNRSSKTSFKKHPQTMAKVYDYFTQNIVDIFSYEKFNADYIDIKGDGAFAIFEGDNATFRAFYAALTFKELFDEKIKSKFADDDNNNLSCKIGIHKDKILVKKIGKRGDYNEVWAGRLINNAAKLSSQYKNIDLSDGMTPIIVSEKIYLDFVNNPIYGLYACHNKDTGESIIEQADEHFKKSADFDDEILGNKFYYTITSWCEHCADDYLNKL